MTGPTTLQAGKDPSGPGDRFRAPWVPRELVPLVSAVLVAWAVTLVRIVPSTYGDHGTFVSVAERLLAGDRLYVGVWDNKDPLFYAVVAAGRWASPAGDVLLELAWVALACASVLAIARRFRARRAPALLGAWVATPLMLTGAAYEPGMTHLPGVAVGLATLALTLRGRWAWAGAAVVVVALLKTILLPTVLVGALVVVLHRRAWRGLATGALVALGVSVLALVVLQARGELSGWLENFSLNSTYASGPVLDSDHGPVVGHLLRAFPEDGRGGGLVSLAVVALTLLLVPRSRGDDVRALAWDLSAATTAAALAVIALTATFPHHLQGLFVGSATALALLASSVGASNLGWRLPVVALLVGWLAGGALHPYYSAQAATGLTSRIATLQAESPESQAIHDVPQVRTYARAGTNDVRAHAVGLGDRRLACARFSQYPIDDPARLAEVLQCLPRADAVLVDDSLLPVAGATEWNTYVAGVERLVSTGYECTAREGFRLCAKDSVLER